MKEQVKNLYLKALLIGIKGIIVLPLIVFLIYEAFITQIKKLKCRMFSMLLS